MKHIHMKTKPTRYILALIACTLLSGCFWDKAATQTTATRNLDGSVTTLTRPVDPNEGHYSAMQFFFPQH